MTLIEQGERQREKILAFIAEFIDENGYSPSMQEVGNAIGSHKNGARHHLLKLQKEGKVTMTEGSYRSIRLAVGDEHVDQLPKADA